MTRRIPLDINQLSELLIVDTASPSGLKMSAPNRPPLWRALKDADASWTSDLTIPEARAIKALRDWLVPEEPLYDGDQRWELERDERQRLRALLTTEADRAERGEVE